MKFGIYGFGIGAGMGAIFYVLLGNFEKAGAEIILLWWTTITLVIYWICQGKWRWM